MKNTSTMIIVAIVVAAVAFYGGMQYQKSQSATALSAMGGRQFAGGAAGGTGAGARFRNGGGQTVGQVIAFDDKSLTVKLQDGSSKIVLVTSGTTFSKADPATSADLKMGDRVAAFGAVNSDGSVTATMVQLNPLSRGPMGASGAMGPGPSGPSGGMPKY